MVEHRSVVNLIYALFKIYPFREGDTYLLKTSFVFDVSVSELVGWFTGGGRLAILEPGAEKDPRQILQTIEKLGVTHINFVPSMFGIFVETLKGHKKVRMTCLKFIFLAGEALLAEMVNRFRTVNQDIALENIYGPTEATIYASKYSLPAGEIPITGTVPIGKPLANMKLYILNPADQLQPVGVPGELGISGTGLARGYLNRPELTVRKFVSIPLAPPTTTTSFILTRAYRTGDLGSWLPDGNIEFLGRIDQQVKIRGHRVELGEIENQLLNHQDLKEVVVTAATKTDNNIKGDQYITAYIVSARKFPLSELREFLSEKLPHYMIPAYFIRMESIPITASGKIDKKSLPEAGVTATERYVPPGDPVEKQLVAIWSEVLGIAEKIIGIDDNFFALGGHSLTATIQGSKIYKAFNITIPLAVLFKTPTIKHLSEYIKSAREETVLVTDEHLALLKKGKNPSSHLFLVHAGSGEVEGYIEFCHRLTLDFNYWGIKAEKIENLTPRNTILEDLAQTYIEKIKKVQPLGPYFIAGWCIGGTIAFEMIRRLEQKGERIEFFAFINTIAPRPELAGDWREFSRETELNWVWNYLPDNEIKEKVKKETDINLIWPSITRHLEDTDFDIDIIKKAIPPHISEATPNFNHLGLRELIYYMNMVRSLVNARNRYIPKSKIRATPHFFTANQFVIPNRKKWKTYCREPLKFYEVNGDHFSIFQLPATVEFAKTFDRVVSQAMI
jgi:thioesterase domain-containing protein/acyl carrier protein